jgi:tetratricopeptide (TPR) repeat protein
LTGRSKLESLKAVVEAADAHIEQGRPENALALTQTLVAVPMPAHAALAAHSRALKALGRAQEALILDRRAVQLYPQSAIAWHNLGAVAGDLELAVEARSALDRAFRMGLEHPETFLAHARACHLMGDAKAAERSFRMALQRRPDDARAASELAELLWMTTADVETATAPLGQALANGADEHAVAATLIKMYEIAGRRSELATLFDRLLSRHPDNAAYLAEAGRAALMDGDPERALGLVDRSLQIDPQQVSTLIHSASVRLALGRSEEALVAARAALQLEPDNQATWGWLATCARAAGSDEHRRLFNYEAFVKAYTIDTPEGWESLDAFLEDLGGVLRNLHRTRAEPLAQSVRGGTQTFGDLAKVDHPVLRSFFQVLDRAILKYMREIGGGEHWYLSRNNGRYRIQSAWSVRLRGQGRHSNHYHPMGWISSAFYVALPPTPAGSREGWIQFGQPPFQTSPEQPPELFLEPKPGRLVLFPSYMWHGTVPFSADAERLTIAFDAVPA